MIDTGEDGFFMRSDGRFFAFMDVAMGIDTPILKSTQKGDARVYPFKAVASTPDFDFEGQRTVQEGLDFAPFIEDGEFNWNHVPHIITGEPTGRKAWFDDASGNWHCEGEIIGGLPIIPGYNTDMMVQQHNQFKKSKSSKGLCVSIEGDGKMSPCGRYLQKGTIYRIAHTFQPVNKNCSLSMLAKSLCGQVEVKARDAYYEAIQKSLAIGDIQPFMKEDLEGGAKDDLSNEDYADLRDSLIERQIRKGFSFKKAVTCVDEILKKKFNK